MTGDQNDMKARVLSALPASWFAAENPVLDAMVTGIAWCLSFVYGLITYAQAQTRIRTATDFFLDLISLDYFNGTLPRNPGESDTSFRSRILANLLVEKGTRAGMIKTLTVLTGRAPTIFEPGRALDRGAYNAPIWGYGSGRYGFTYRLPYQAFVTAYRGNGVSDDDIRAAVNAAKPEGSRIWLAISN